jgi:ABC-type Mn2+/Zn2+ transport system ATPase subunit
MPSNSSANAKNTILEIQNISISYNGHQVISNFSLSLNQGDKLVIEGPNGCGKTTLLKAILGNVKTQKGKVLLASNARTAYCKQGFAETKTPISVTEVVSMGLYKAKAQVKNANKDFSKAKVQLAMQQAGVSPLANRNFSVLSGGEKQRVNLARCFCQDANLLLLDEPSSFLDANFRDEFASMMRDLPPYMSAIVVTHDAQLTQALGWPVVKMAQTQAASLAQTPPKETSCND